MVFPFSFVEILKVETTALLPEKILFLRVHVIRTARTLSSRGQLIVCHCTTGPRANCMFNLSHTYVFLCALPFSWKDCRVAHSILMSYLCLPFYATPVTTDRAEGLNFLPRLNSSLDTSQ